jgi:hypothetical protein
MSVTRKTAGTPHSGQRSSHKSENAEAAMARKLKLKVPKRIAGVKIPKAVRKGPVADFLNSSAGQLLLAEALLVLGGAAAAKRLDADSDAGEFVRHPIQSLTKAGRLASSTGAGAAEDLGRDSNRLSFAFSEALRAFRSGLDQYRPDGQEAAQDTGSVATADLPGDSGRAKKKVASSPTDTPSTPH